MSTPGEPTDTQGREARGLSSIRCLLGSDLTDLTGLRTRLLNSDPTYLRMQNADLLETIADRDEHVKRLEALVEKLRTKVESRDEINCLQSEVIRLLDAAIVRPKEVDSLLARIQALTKK